MQRILIVGSLIMSMWVLGGCGERNPSNSPLFDSIFLSDSSTFRGIEPGMLISEVQRIEGSDHLVFEDQIGLSYEYSLGENQLMILDFHSDRLASFSGGDWVISIVANILLENEVESAKLYNEIAAYFNQKYGVSSGLFGNYSWEGLTRIPTSMEIRLKMMEDKKGLTINFINLEPLGKVSETVDANP